MHLRKIDEINLTQPATKEIISLALSNIDQLNRKAEVIQALDAKIQNLIEGAEDTERDTFESIEVQDTIIEQVVRLKRFVEKNRTVNPTPPVIHPSGDRDEDPVAHPTSASRLPKPDFLDTHLNGRHFGTPFKQLST